MADDLTLNKVAIIERCLARVREVYGGDDDHIFSDLTRQDSIILNLQRACEATIDLAMHLVSVHRLGIPQETRQAFDLLGEAGILTAEVAERISRMIGFRNIAVRDYHKLDLEIVKRIVTDHLGDFSAFTQAALAHRA
jgi:uncharacterized protein YutE (UPF0331/DUF86 family)